MPGENLGYPDFIDSISVSYDANGGSTSGTAQTKRPGLTYGQTETGAAAEALADAVRTGYDFTGWYDNTDNAAKAGNDGLISMDTVITNSSDHSIAAGWKPLADTIYKVEHYQQKEVGSSEYILKETQTLRGTTAATVSAAALNYPGYQEDTTYAARAASGVIDGDGSLVLKLYYKKLPAALTFYPTDSNSGVLINKLDEKVRITDEERNNSSQIIIYLKVEELEGNALSSEIREKAQNQLSAEGQNILDVFDISIFKRIVRSDSTIWEGKVANDDLFGMITVRIPISQQYLDKENLSVAFIDEAGNIEIYATRRVVIEGVSYLEFETDHFSMYAVIQMDAIPNASGEIPATGEQGLPPLLPMIILAAGAVVVYLRRSISKTNKT